EHGEEAGHEQHAHAVEPRHAVHAGERLFRQKRRNTCHSGKSTESIKRVVPPSKSFPFRLEFPPELPISARAEEITAAIQAHAVVILAGETGSGKTTQIPKMCLAAGRGVHGRIACTQPRRVAALSISRRVAEELGVAWGREVGCKIRFNDQTSAGTVIKFVTDGMLLAEV